MPGLPPFQSLSQNYEQEMAGVNAKKSEQEPVPKSQQL